MATIAFIPLSIQGDVNASLALARSLKDRGHDVHYLAIPDLEDRIRAQGFGFVPLLENVHPRGKTDSVNQRAARGERITMSSVIEGAAREQQALSDGAIEAASRALRPDLYVVASGWPMAAIAAYGTGRPVVLFSSNLISPYDPLVPPLSSPLVPDGSRRFRLKTWLTWKRLFLEKSVAQVLNRAGERKDHETMAKRFNYPLEKIDFSAESWPRLDMPEVVLCPQAFDLPRERRLDKTEFIEPGVDVRRTDHHPFSWDRIDAAKPLVFCAAGSMASYMHPELAQRLLQLFLDAMSTRPNLQGLAAIGRYATLESFRVPANVVAVTEVPQIDVLKRASLMVTHGGLNSVKEAIYFGVPMIVFPLFFDHPGYAARIEYHRIGRTANVRSATAIQLTQLIDDVIGDEMCLARVRAMSKVFVELQARSPGADVIERVLRDHAKVAS